MTILPRMVVEHLILDLVEINMIYPTNKIPTMMKMNIFKSQQMVHHLRLMSIEVVNHFKSMKIILLKLNIPLIKSIKVKKMKSLEVSSSHLWQRIITHECCFLSRLI